MKPEESKSNKDIPVEVEKECVVEISDEEQCRRMLEDVRALTGSGPKNGSSASMSINIVPLPANSKFIMQALHENEDGDSQLLIKLFKDMYCYDHAAACWYYWNEHYWRLDKLNHVVKLVLEIIDQYGNQKAYEILAAQAAKSDGDAEVEKRHTHNIKLLSERMNSLRTIKRKNNVIRLACNGLGSLGITGEEWDQKPMLLPVRNGVINLESGVFTDGKPSDFLKTSSPINWEGIDAPCPTWEAFILSIFGGNQEIADYMRRLLGYSIAGLTTEHIYPILWGAEGRNGKGTMLEIMKHILGPLAYKAPPDFLMQQQGKNSSGPDADTMALHGARLVWCSETNENDRLNVAKLKELVGGDTLSARPPYGKRQIEFIPTHTLFLITNKRPKVPANDPALWRRIHLIPFLISFLTDPDPNNPNQQQADPNLKEKLKKEAPGILAWLVCGFIEWQEFGLLPPQCINDATNTYRSDEDIIGHFISECCYTGDLGYRVKPKELYERYKNWCDEVGHKAMAKKRFLDDMRSRFELYKDYVNYFRGIGLVDE